MKLKFVQKTVSLVLGAAVVLSGVAGTNVDAAAKKASLAKKSYSVEKGKKVTIKIKNKVKKATYTFKSSKATVASVTKKGVVLGKKVGTAKIVVTEKVKKSKKKLGVVTITVKPVSAKKDVPETSAEPSGTPVVSATPAASATPVASVQPSGTPAVSAAPVASAEPSETPVVSEEPVVTPEPAWNVKEIETTMFNDEFFCPVDYDDGDDEEFVYPSYESISYYSTTVGKDRKAWVLLPKDYSKDKKYPVLYLLHGISGDESEWKNSGHVQYMLQNLIDAGKAKEMIVVLPNDRARMNDAGTGEMSVDHFKAHDNFINDLRDDLMPYINENFSTLTDRNNTAIAGLSMGGRESLYIGLSMPETFGYIGAFEPAVGVLPYATEGGLFTEETMKLPEEYVDRTLIMIIKGTNDNTVGDAPLLYHNTLDKNGTPNIYYLTGGFKTNGKDGGGAHGWEVWKSSFYNFAQRIFNH